MSALLSKTQIEARLPLWRVLSDLFLDTELQNYHYEHIAEVVLESNFKPSEVQRFLWDEVFPALADNLRIATGEWGAFEDDWLRQRIPNVLSGKEPGCGSYGLISVDDVRVIIADAWVKVCKYLPSDYRDSANVINQKIADK